jgi:KipI family sensor histidine kinase inhibitor
MVSDDRRPVVLEAGDGALVVEFGDDVDAAVNARVVALDAAVAAARLQGVMETVPTYRSLLVHYDPLAIAPDRLKEQLLALAEGAGAGAAEPRRWRVPVCYGGAHGVDLEAVATRHGLTPEAVVAAHSGAEYRVYMIGFAPGFIYLGGLPEILHTDRRHDPRMKTPARSVSIGGRQAGISPPIEMPSGWHLLGRTPVRTWDAARTSDPFLFQPGDVIRFHPVEEAVYDEMCRAADAGEPIATREAVDG